MKTVEDLPELSPSSLTTGSAYVAARYQSKGELLRIPLARPTVGCDHNTRICEEKECLRWWQFDHILLFENTAGGRDLIARAGVECDRRVQIILNAFKDKPSGTFMLPEEIVGLEKVDEAYRWPAWPILERLYLSVSDRWAIPDIEIYKEDSFSQAGARKL